MAFSLLLALGLGAAAGLRPFMPALMVGVASLASLRINLDGTSFAFLEQLWWLIVILVAMIVGYALIRVVAIKMLDVAIGSLAIIVGTLLAAGVVAARESTWWYGAVIGAVAALLAIVVARQLTGRVRARFVAAGDEGAGNSLPVYAEVAACVAALVTLVFPPLALLVIAGLIWLLIAGRKREQQKYAGLRILR